MAPRREFVANCDKSLFLFFDTVNSYYRTSKMAVTACSAQALPYPNLVGANFLSLAALLVTNYTAYIPPAGYANNYGRNVTDVSFCNVTVTYTHPGQNDEINVEMWLPTQTWNGRMLGVGGGGWNAGGEAFILSNMTLGGGIADGYAALTTDAGHTSPDPREWGLVSPGNVNMYLLQDFAAVSLNDLAVIGKSLIESFYGQPPKYSYWSGCSGGGRQGYQLAQRYPDAFDGIAAAAPAINWGQWGVADFYPQVVMNEMGAWPFPCELDAITAAVVDMCDAQDGVVDDIVWYPDYCYFNPHNLVGTSISCSNTGSMLQISEAAAKVAEAVWGGARSMNGSFLWYGKYPDAVLTGDSSSTTSATHCASGTCTGLPMSISQYWIQVYITKNPDFNTSTITREQFDQIFHDSVDQYSSILSSANTDLSQFKASGGKLITYHGLADPLLSPMTTRNYYDAVTALDPDVHDFYRLFFSPGLDHCAGGKGGYPGGTFKSLADWVESGIIPETLNATTAAGTIKLLCPYPAVSIYKGVGDKDDISNYECVQTEPLYRPL